MIKKYRHIDISKYRNFDISKYQNIKIFKKFVSKIFIFFAVIALLLGDFSPVLAGTITLYPSANGTYDAWSRSGCALSYDCVDDGELPDYDLTFLYTNINGARVSFNLPDNQTPAGKVVTKIAIGGYLKRTLGGASFKFFYRLNGINYDGSSNFSPDNSYTFYSQTWSGLNLSQTDINNLEIGVLSTNNKGLRITQIQVVLEWNEPPNQPSNVSPTNGETNVSRNPTLTSSAFSDPNSDDTHAASEWQITNQSGNYNPGNPGLVWASGETTTNLTSIVVNSTNGTFQGELAGQTQLGECKTYFWRVRHKDNYNEWSAWSQETSFTTLCPPPPDAALFINATEPSLTDGGRVYQTIDVFGTNFGSGPCDGVSNAVKIGTYTVSCSDVDTWSNNFIAFTIPAGIDVYGGTGTAGLIIRARGNDDPTPLTFYVYPDIISLTTPQVANAAREYDPSDSDGLITLNGFRFGSGGNISILGVPATVVNYTDTAVTVQVPQAIADNLYTGSIVLTRTNPSDSKTDTWSAFRVLPRITSLVPDNGIEGDPVQINGNHFCQSGTCPPAGSRSTASDNVKFYNNIQVPDADISTWTDTQINVKVPTGASTGPVIVTSASYLSNGKTFTVNVPTPQDPTDLRQYKTDGVTEILVGQGTNEDTVKLKMTMAAYVPGTLYPQVEVKPIGVNFDGSGIIEGPGVPYSGTPVAGWVTVSSLSDGVSYHWRARIRRAPNFYSNWVVFGGNNDPNDVDFYVDLSPPTFYLGTDNSCATAVSEITDSSAKIIWSTFDQTSGALNPPGGGAYSTAQVEYLKASDFSDWSTTPGNLSDFYPRENSPHNVLLSNLSPSTQYVFRLRSKDAVGNEGFSHTGTNYCSFTTSAARPIKTIEKFISQELNPTTGNLLTYNWSIYIPESPGGLISLKSAFIEIQGLSGEGNQTLKAEIKRGILDSGSYEDSGAANFNFDTTGGGITPFTIYFDVLNPNANPPNCSACQGFSDIIQGAQTYNYTLYLKGTSLPIYLLGAKLILTYSYSL